VPDEGKNSPGVRSLECRKICDRAQRHRQDAALAVLVAIMEDEATAPRFRIVAANSVLAWVNIERAAEAAVGGKGEQRRSPVGIAWFGPPQALATSAKSGAKDLS
jgi:hypothetical protein